MAENLIYKFTTSVRDGARVHQGRTTGSGPAKTGEGLTGCDGGQQVQVGHGRVPTGPVRAGHGWSELVATNARVADEPVDAVFRMNENPILPARIFIFFSPLLYPKIFPCPTYHLPTPPPSLHRQSSWLQRR